MYVHCCYENCTTPLGHIRISDCYSVDLKLLLFSNMVLAFKTIAFKTNLYITTSHTTLVNVRIFDVGKAVPPLL